MTGVDLRRGKIDIGLTARIFFWAFSPAVLPISFQAAADACRDDAAMVKIPSGEFIMGSDRQERDYGYTIGGDAARKYRWYDRWELDRSQEHLPVYYISRTLTTQRDYRRFVLATGHRPPSITAAEYQEQGYLVHPYEEVRKYLWSSNEGDSRPEYESDLALHPVVLVSLSDAQSFCRWQGDSRGVPYRLPTEAEWEKAARGLDGRYFPWGNELDPTRLNFDYIYQGTTVVGNFPTGTSPYGVLDMAGNVFEWTSTPFGQDKMTLKGGGSWDDKGGICRAASRHGRVSTARHILIGFRCVCDPQ